MRIFWVFWWRSGHCPHTRPALRACSIPPRALRPRSLARLPSSAPPCLCLCPQLPGQLYGLVGGQARLGRERGAAATGPQCRLHRGSDAPGADSPSLPLPTFPCTTHFLTHSPVHTLQSHSRCSSPIPSCWSCCDPIIRLQRVTRNPPAVAAQPQLVVFLLRLFQLSVNAAPTPSFPAARRP